MGRVAEAEPRSGGEVWAGAPIRSLIATTPPWPLARPVLPRARREVSGSPGRAADGGCWSPGPRPAAPQASTAASRRRPQSLAWDQAVEAQGMADPAGLDAG